MTLFHGCILQDPGGYQPDSYRTVVTGFGSGRVHLVLAKPVGSDLLVLQSIKYPNDLWTEQRAQFACDARSGAFAPALEDESTDRLEETFDDVFFSEEQLGHLVAGHEMSVEELETALIEPIQPTELSHLEGVEDGNFFHLAQELLGVEDRDGLIWKQLLITGRWPGNKAVPPLIITNEMLDQIDEAFKAGVLAHVDVPDGHTNSTLANTGFVRALEIRELDGERSLWVGIEFTEPDVKDKVIHGTIANVSAGLEKGFTDPISGKTWPWVLWHVALTNKPVLKDLQPFITASLDGLDVRVYKYQSSPDDERSDDRFQQQEVTQVEQDQNSEQQENPEVEQQESSSQEESTMISLSQEDMERLRQDEREKARREFEQENTSTIQELRREAETATALARDSQRQLHANDVRAIVGALGGRGEHERVRLQQGCVFAPMILKLVQPLLERDLEGNTVIKLSQDGGEVRKSVTDIVLDILNAVADADAIIELDVAKGTQTHVPPASGNTPSPQEQDSQVDAYLEERGLSLVGAQQE